MVFAINDPRHIHGIGLIATSRHQGIWHHQPNVNAFVPGQYTNQVAGVNTTRWGRTPLIQQFTGHTAVFSRVNGNIVFARGFVPRWYGYLGAFLGQGGSGTWQDDIHMTRDPTCIGFEIPTNYFDARRFDTWFRTKASQINTYSLQRGNAFRTFNCVLAAATVLISYLLDTNNITYQPYIDQLAHIDSSNQGMLMRRIMQGM